jgi:TetR/AcrR family transcriptional regulator
MNAIDENQVAAHADNEHSTKRKILEAARHEFAVHGLAGARVDQIAVVAGVNKAMIYYYYQSKENLHTEVIRDHFQRIGEILRSRIATPSTLEECLSEVLEGHVRLAQQAPEFIPILVRELADPRPAFMDQMAGMMMDTGLPMIIRGKIMEAQHEGEIRTIDPRQLAISLITMSIGYFIMAPLVDRIMSVTNHLEFVEQRKSIILDIFMNGVKAR